MSSIIPRSLQSIGDDLAGQSLSDGLISRRIAVDDQAAVRRQKSGEGVEGIADIRQILEEIQMILLNI